MKISIRQKLLPLSFIILAGNGLIGYAVYKSNQKMLDSEKWVQHTEQVIYASGEILSLCKDVQITSRGFVMTNDSTFLHPVVLPKTIFAHIRQLGQLTRDNPAQQSRIDSLNFYVRNYLDVASQIVALRSKRGLAAAIDYNSTRHGKYYSDRIRQIIQAIQKEENMLLKQRKQTNEESSASFNQVSVIMFISMAVFTVLLLIVTGNYLLQNKEKEKRAGELIVANKELAFQNKEKGKRSAELILANEELAFQNEEKEKRSVELIMANRELGFQNEEKEKRATELIVANQELAFQNEEKEKRAAELIVANHELAFQNEEKEKRADELVIANHELAFQNEEKGKRADELVVANRELAFQNEEKGKRAEELVIANEELAFQNEEKEKRAIELITANKDLESFSYSVSHDLRAPLRAVHGYARMLKEDFGTQLDGESNRVINSIMTNASKMGKLLDDLLAFSRFGRKELVKMNISMQDMAADLCREMKNEPENQNIQFKVNNLEGARGDSVVIKQVWINLISNAIKYSRHAETPTIEISSEVKGEEIIYSIKDNGAGFDMRYVDKLFGVFQRLHTDEQFEGTGIGLAIVHRIITKHKGRVWAEGKVNEGATFYFSLPIHAS